MGLKQIQKKERESLLIMPCNEEFISELAEKTNYKLNKDGTLTLKNKLVMREGTHNDVYYPWEELKAKYLTGEGAGLFYDHEDSVQNYAGLVKNLKTNDITKEIRGDIHVTNKQSALDISLGAKWGISATIDAEKVLVNGKNYAKDPNTLSYSLVLRPAVRETMLNSENINRKGDIKMEGKERELNELSEKVTQKDSKITELNAKIEKLGEEVAESKKLREEAEKKESDKEAEELCALENSIGFTTEATTNTRLEELKSMSSESRSHLKSTHAKYVKILNLEEAEKTDEDLANELKESFMAFRKKMLEDNPEATNEEIKIAYAKQIGQPVENAEAKKEEDLSQTESVKKTVSELAAKVANTDKVNSGILNYMKEQERK